MKNNYKLLNILLACILLQGCADKRPAEEIVKEKSQTRLDLLMAGNFEKALKYTTPSYQERTSVESYFSRFAGAGNWTEVMVESVVCEPEKCDVVTMISYKMKIKFGMAENTRPLEERWIKTDGKWFIYHGK